jgi:hypothetical protein
VGTTPTLLKSDGADIWVVNNTSETVSRVRASDGKLLDTWTGATSAWAVLVAMGRVFVTGLANPGTLYVIDPAAAGGPIGSPVTSALGDSPAGVAFDGSKIWTANTDSVSIVTPGTWSVTPAATGAVSPADILFDGANIWISDGSNNTLKKLDANGTVAQSVAVGSGPAMPAFDGNNIWVPNILANALTVVRVSDGAVIQTFSAANGNQNGLNQPSGAAFDGRRILVTNANGGLSLFKAADLSAVGFFATPVSSTPTGSVAMASTSGSASSCPARSVVSDERSARIHAPRVRRGYRSGRANAASQAWSAGLG